MIKEPVQVAVREVDEADVLAHLRHDLFHQARDVHHRDRGPGGELDREVGVAHRVQAVHAQAVEAERLGHALDLASDWFLPPNSEASLSLKGRQRAVDLSASGPPDAGPGLHR
jgi:hypothetical protein